jgi:hypothetical protein
MGSELPDLRLELIGLYAVGESTPRCQGKFQDWPIFNFGVTHQDAIFSHKSDLDARARLTAGTSLPVSVH